MATADSTLPLVRLNKSTASLGTWLLKTARAAIVEYTYQCQGKPITNRKLQVVLVSTNPEEYCIGILKARNQNFEELDKALQERWKPDSVWKMTKVAFTDDKPAYIHAPFKMAIDIRGTTWTFCLTEPHPMPSTPSPPAPIKDLVAIKVQRRQSQRFDVTGLLSMSAVRYTPGQLLIRGLLRS